MLRYYQSLILQDPEIEGKPVGYEISFDFNGLPLRFKPLSTWSHSGKYELVHVDEEDYRKNKCRKWIYFDGREWKLRSNGISHLDLLTYAP